ncbi:PA2169 family four-helix-bundle protein [Pseudomonas sp. Gutcm_11s]|uniref:PA2169 family four-helix-bundle protein n=1 Tax=Pseudomonas sp. Gutcm_11s TaxID=3026088 RepID=UPI00235F51C5|nr:PA2169 family four-helix-bundle protein [Pseudomonas sp. Gutcm_11s]MDD0844962.1 PA2169 family four-helix-bundle protein [Pseudomonas sp. Gutcm_11s]
MTGQAHLLNELIEITRDGELFYQHAEARVQDAQLKALFRDMAALKAEVIRDLALEVAAEHEQPSSGHSLTGSLRQLYADGRARLAADGEVAYVGQLEAAEDRLLQAFEQALGEADASEVALLEAELVKLRAGHARMSQMQRTINQAGASARH